MVGNPRPDMGSLVSRLPLTLILVICTVAELALRRVATPMLMFVAPRDSRLFQVVSVSGQYFFYLAGLLALVMLGWASVVLIRDRNLLGTPQRVALTLAASMFLPVLGVGITLDVPRFVVPHLSAMFALFVAVLVLGIALRPGPLGARLGMLYLAAPLLLRCYWRLTQHVPALGLPDLVENLPTLAYRASEHLVVVGAYAVYLFFAPQRRRAAALRPVPLAVALTATAAAAAHTRLYPSIGRSFADLGFGLVLPETPGSGLLHEDALLFLMHFGGLFFVVLTLATLAGGTRTQRNTMLGLALVMLAGFHGQLPSQSLVFQFLVTLVGLLAIGRAALEEGLQRRTGHQPAADGGLPTASDWNTYLRQLAAACSMPAGSGESVLLQTDDRHVGHVRGRRDGEAFVVRVLCGQGGLEQLEVIMGTPPREPPPASVSRRRGQRGSRVRDGGVGQRVRIAEDGAFDRQFVIRDGTRRLADLLADSAVRRRIEAAIHGWLGLWPGEGLRYLSSPGPDGWPVPVAEVAFAPEDADTREIQELLAVLTMLRKAASA